MAKKRKGLPLKEIIAVTLTIMFVILAGGMLFSSPLMDELDKMFSDAGISVGTDKPNNNGANEGSDESGEGTTFSLEEYAGPLEFNDDSTDSSNSEEYSITLPILRNRSFIEPLRETQTYEGKIYLA